MASLREILEKQRQEKANAEQKSAAQSNVQTQQPNTIVGADQAKNENPIVSGPVEIVPGNGSNSGQEIAPVPPAGLGGIALLKWRKEHGNTQTNKTAATVGNSAPILPEKPIAPAVPSVSQSVIGAREAEKTNDGTIEVEQLKNNLIYLANNIEQKELVAQIVRTIAVQLKNNPEICSFMQNSDVDLVVRGMRMAYKVAARKKSDAVDAKAKKKGVSDELAQAFKDAGLDGLDLGLK